MGGIGVRASPRQVDTKAQLTFPVAQGLCVQPLLQAWCLCPPVLPHGLVHRARWSPRTLPT